MAAPTSTIAEQLDLSVLRYSRVWEDYRVLCKGLDIKTQDVILSITSSGDNVLNMLLEEPQKIYAVDMSPAQNAFLELKLAAIRHLKYEEFLQLIGEMASDKRSALLDQIMLYLPNYAKEYWSKNIALVESGITDSGRLEKYLQVFHEKHLSALVSPDKLDKFYESQTLEEQKQAFQHLPLEELQSLIRWYFSKSNLKEGRSEAQFQYVDLSSDQTGMLLSERYFEVAQNVPVHDNFYFSLLSRGRRGYNPAIKPNFSPPYLTKENFQKLKGLVDRIIVQTTTIEAFLTTLPDSAITKANLSDIFEYMNEENSNALFLLLAQKMASGGRLAYWELLVTHHPPAGPQFIFHEALSKELHQIDRVFAYKSFNIYEIK